jgi:hypothetical protein
MPERMASVVLLSGDYPTERARAKPGGTIELPNKGRAKTSALWLAAPISSISPCAGFESSMLVCAETY